VALLKSCFVVMPITTPKHLLPAYGNDPDHFQHVRDHLLGPALQSQGFLPMWPASQGSNLIHADVIEKLVQSDLVLCDMSGLNPNVFFEMGIRTALNKPLAFVVDDVSHESVPFDTGLVNHHVYVNALRPWTLPDEIERLSRHIETSWAGSPRENPLWKHFGLHLQAETWNKADEEVGALELLRFEIEALKRKLDHRLTRDGAGEPGPSSSASNVPQGPSAVWIEGLADLSVDELARLERELGGRLSRTASRAEESSLELSIAAVKAERANRAHPSKAEPMDKRER
jgi:hypothetical protein